MNCCNEYGDCRQGRNCPARVAKVKRRTPKDAQPLRPGFTWRRNLKRLALWLAISWVVLVFGLIFMVAFGAVRIV